MVNNPRSPLQPPPPPPSPMPLPTSNFMCATCFVYRRFLPLSRSLSVIGGFLFCILSAFKWMMMVLLVLMSLTKHWIKIDAMYATHVNFFEFRQFFHSSCCGFSCSFQWIDKLSSFDWFTQMNGNNTIDGRVVRFSNRIESNEKSKYYVSISVIMMMMESPSRVNVEWVY